VNSNRRPDRRAVALLSGLLALHLVWGAQYVYRTSFVHGDSRVFTLWDDAMISMQYARNLNEGAGLVWNAGGERVLGVSNPGVTFAMAALHALPLPPTQTSLALQVLALGMATLTLWMVWRLARRLASDGDGGPGSSDAVAVAAVVATVLCAPVQVWSLQGSDVGFVALWLVASVWVLTTPRPAWIASLVLASGLWIRPDSVLAFGLLLVFARHAAGGGQRVVALGAGLGALFVGAQLLVAALYYGDPLPNTYYLKATGAPRDLMIGSGLGELLGWLPQLAPALVLAGYALWRRPLGSAVMACGAIVVVAEAYNVWVGGDFITGYASRFVAPTLPLLWVLVALGAGRLAARQTSRLPRVAVVGLVGLVAIVANPATSRREWLDPTAATMHRDNNANNYNFALYLRDHTHPTTTLGAHWGGVPVYFSRRPAIDVLGKSDRHIAKLEVDRFFPGHSKWDWDYVLEERRPDVFRAPSRGLGDRRDFRSAYVKVQTQRGLSFFMRRDALDKLVDREVVIVDLTTGRPVRTGRRDESEES
jgi:hypothetical protein